MEKTFEEELFELNKKMERLDKQLDAADAEGKRLQDELDRLNYRRYIREKSSVLPFIDAPFLSPN